MKRFFSSFLLVVVLFTTLLSPIKVYAIDSSIPQLENTDNAAMAALYEVIKDSGYNIYTPGSYSGSDSFTTVMNPLLNRVKSLGYTVGDAFYYVGDKMYYAFDTVSTWVKALFGDNYDQEYSVGGGSVGNNYPFGQDYPDDYRNVFNQSINLFKDSSGEPLFPDLGSRINYCMFKAYNGTVSSSSVPRSIYVLPVLAYGSQYYSYNLIECNLNVHDFGDYFTLNFVSFNDGTFIFTDTSTGQTLSPRISSVVFYEYNTSYTASVNVRNYLMPSFHYKSSSYSRSEAILEYLTWLNSSVCFNCYYILHDGDDIYTNYTAPESYKLTSFGHTNTSHNSFEPVEWQYITNNWGSADTIYQTINNTEYESHDKYFDFDFDFDVDVEKSVNDLVNLPGTFETLSDSAIDYVGGGGFSGQVSNIINGLPSDLVWAVTVASIILLVTGLINRLLR